MDIMAGLFSGRNSTLLIILPRFFRFAFNAVFMSVSNRPGRAVIRGARPPQSELMS
jgi:hypothetical protein